MASSTENKTLTTQLSKLLAVSISELTTEPQTRGSSGNVTRVNLTTKDMQQVSIILKKSEGKDFLEFYTHFLEALGLNHPKIYGEVNMNGSAYIVMQYINHVTPDWDSKERYQAMIDWLIYKDGICMEYVEKAAQLTYVGKVKFHGISDWYTEFENAVLANNISVMGGDFWELLQKQKRYISQLLKSLTHQQPLTVCHGDLQMNNFLFVEEKQDHLAPIVIDWTQPSITSVCRDLAQVVDCAPTDVKENLKSEYRRCISIPNFEESFHTALLLRHLGYFAWMILMINNGSPEKEYHEELRQSAANIRAALPAPS